MKSMKKISILVVLFSLVLFSCNNTAVDEKVVTETDGLRVSKMEHIVMSVVWYQQSAEMQACYYQTFNFAKRLVDENKAKATTDLPKAVVVDVDETMLDNSPFEVERIRTGTAYSNENWKEWTDQMKAKALPGAVEFAKYAEEKGVEVFYISNRKLNEVESSIKNLKAEGFPFVDEAHILFKDQTSDKTERRAIVSENYEIILLIGDNLGDFDELFNERTENMGFDKVNEHKDNFGSKFLILPNPMYGTWEKVVYNGDYSISDKEKDESRKKILY